MSLVSDWPALSRELSKALGSACAAAPERAIAGGCINECYRWSCGRGPLFVKIAPAERLAAFEAEAEGLDELRRARAVSVPAVIGHGSSGRVAWLALEWIEPGEPDAAADALLGEQLAWQHRVSAPHFGWRRDNTIGSTPQINTPHEDWVAFLRERRLRFQLDLAAQQGFAGGLRARGELLLEHLGAFFTSYRPVPSLLHGDLWGGNWMVDAAGEPVIFDPAVYFGDREADIAMTRLFGGFGPGFYSAYVSEWPLDAAAGTRRGLYDLYHVLNHANLFGGGYVRQATALVGRLLAELGL